MTFTLASISYIIFGSILAIISLISGLEKVTSHFYSQTKAILF